MKKFLYLLIALPLLGLLSACDDDNKPPEVNFNVDYTGAVRGDDGVLYVVQGEDFTITSVSVTPVDGTKPATIGYVTYFWDYSLVGTVNVAPFTVTFDTETQLLGRHLLQLNMTVAQVDKPLAEATISARVMIVESAEEIPGYTPDTDKIGTLSDNGNLKE